MAPRRGARRGAATRRGRDARGRVEDEVSQHGEHPEVQAEQQGGEMPQPANQNPNPPNAFAEFVAALATQNLSIQPNRGETNSRDIELVREFHRMDPPKFDGRVSDPLASDHWLSEIREQFEVLGIREDELRIRLITCQLVGEAKVWWQSVRAERKDARRAARAMLGIDGPDVENMTWVEFESKFESRYFPRSFKANLRIQFEKLEQGSNSVSEYIVQFQSLTRFAPELASTEEMKCWRFVRGLNPNIRRFMLGSKQDVFEEVTEYARALESDEEETRGARKAEPRQSYPSTQVTTGTNSGQNRKRSRELMQSTSGLSVARTPTVSGTGGDKSRSSVTCFSCGQAGHYRSQCTQQKALPPPRVRAPGACYVCGGMGHMARSCPQRKDNQSGSESVQQPPQTQEHGWQQQGGSREQPYYHQTTVVQGATGERGASSSVQPPLTRGRVYNVMSAIPSSSNTSSQVPDTQTVRGTFFLSYLSFSLHSGSYIRVETGVTS